MQRRSFLRNTLLTTGSFAAATGAFSQTKSSTTSKGQPFHLDYAPHEGMFATSGGKDFIDQIKYMYDLGFRSIEDNGMTGRSTEQQTKIGETLAKLGMRMGFLWCPKEATELTLWQLKRKSMWIYFWRVAASR
ncbi:hypothetical protein LWM68_03335 [Niabella sp. W65]|nr:hypothetical protein [Niabella sp. W65]MCH7361896.1 hypothetical protein [Niabella sp. W65]ULT45653.1 hypothetical protein KRR40_21875 [Niabella sp. I65]